MVAKCGVGRFWPVVVEYSHCKGVSRSLWKKIPHSSLSLSAQFDLKDTGYLSSVYAMSIRTRQSGEVRMHVLIASAGNLINIAGPCICPGRNMHGAVYSISGPGPQRLGD